MKIILNPTTEYLYKKTLENKENSVSSTGALIVKSGEYTGRCPKDKRIIMDSNTKNIWWGDINIPITKFVFDYYSKIAKDYLFIQNEETYIIDCYSGWDYKYRLKIRTVCTNPYHALFIKNMLIPADIEFDTYDFCIYNVGNLKLNNYDNIDKTLSDKLVALDLTENEMIIFGTEYAGEMKKGILTLMMYKMLNLNTLPLHSSANMDNHGNTSLFFGLSGTGKTTLSADINRRLIGDDEHVWTDDGVFNIEGGCYAKCIGLNKENEPEIFNAIKYGSLLENVVVKDKNGTVDYNDTSITVNTRCAYPLNYISNSIIPAIGNHPKNIILLTCDAFGVLPPVSRLNNSQAVYFFISGYTSKMPGTEIGILKPEAVFSACFGAAFLIWQPEKYGKLLMEKLIKHNTNVWLINTGWIGGTYPDGKRIPLKYTRRIINSINNGNLLNVKYEKMSLFNIDVPQECDDIPKSVLNPREGWTDKKQYDIELNNLYNKFNINFN